MGSQGSRPQEKDGVEMLQDSGKYALEQAGSFFSMFATKVKTKADEHGVSSAASYYGSSLKEGSYYYGSSLKDGAIAAKNYSVKKSQAVRESYNDGTLVEKATKKASKAGTIM